MSASQASALGRMAGNSRTLEQVRLEIEAEREQLADAVDHLRDEIGEATNVGAKLAQPLADDAEFLRKLKPSLIKARAKGEAPTNQKPGHGTVAPSGPQLGTQPKPKRQSGPSPFLVLGVAFAAGILIAKIIDWRGDAYPRD
jgi:hypothetical protein